jgi:hypothetical protein
MSLITLNSND